MPIPAHLWLYDDGGAPIKGSSLTYEREGSIELISFSHGINLPVDHVTGRITGPRAHSPVSFEKEFDSSSPYLYKAVSTGQNLKSAEFRWYRIDDAGRESLYFRMLMEGVKICGMNPGLPHTKLTEAYQLNHIESVSLRYERITWHYLDGNIQYTDSWLER